MTASGLLTDRYGDSPTPWFTLVKREFNGRPFWFMTDPWGNRTWDSYHDVTLAVWALNLINRLYGFTPPKRRCWCGLAIGGDVDRCDLHDDGKRFPVSVRFRPVAVPRVVSGATKKDRAKAYREQQTIWRD